MSIELEQKIKGKSVVIGVIGLGYVGLPLAVTFAEAGFKVLGFDKDVDKVTKVNSGKSYIVDVDSDRLGHSGLQATTNFALLGQVDAVMICVPTPFTEAKNPDLQFVVAAGDNINRNMRFPQLVVLESTTYPGSTRKDLLPILERGGRTLDNAFFLAFSPEMIDPGNNTFNTANTLKVVGGITPRSTELACLLYSQICSCVVQVSSSEAAELVKVFSNTFRNVNIALVNELAQLCSRMGVSVWEVIDAAAKKPFGYMPFYPGPGTGGHCIPKDPYYLSHKAMELNFHARFIELAACINEQMPEYVLGEIMKFLNKHGLALQGTGVLVLGVAFKRDIADTRESTSIKLIELLLQHCPTVAYNDPFVPEIEVGAQDHKTRMQSVKMAALPHFDLVIVATDHTCYDPEDIVVRSKLVYDTRGITRFAKTKSRNVVRLGEPIL